MNLYIHIYIYTHPDLTVPYYIFGTFGCQFPIYQVTINLLELEDEGIYVYIYIYLGSEPFSLTWNAHLLTSQRSTYVFHPRSCWSFFGRKIQVLAKVFGRRGEEFVRRRFMATLGTECKGLLQTNHQRYHAGKLPCAPRFCTWNLGPNDWLWNWKQESISSQRYLLFV